MPDDLFESEKERFLEKTVNPKIKSRAKAASGKQFEKRTRFLTRVAARELILEGFKTGFYLARDLPA